MSVLAYGYDRKRDDLRPLEAEAIYLDGPADRRMNRAALLADLRDGDVVRVLFFSDLGGPQWKHWRKLIEAEGATLEEHRPVKPAKRPGRRPNHPDTPELREAWLEVGPGLDARLAACGKVIGQTLTRADRHWLYARYGKPGAPK